MTGTSLAGYTPYFQVEAAPGTAETDAMVRVDGIRSVRPGRGSNAEVFKGSNGKVASGVILQDDWTVWSATPLACFRAAGLPLASRLGKPTTTTPVGATLARQHVFVLDPNAPDDSAFYTLLWSDGTNTFESAYTGFQSFGFNAQRSSIECSTGLVGKLYDTGAAAPSSGVTDMASKPMQPNKGDVWVDPNWGALGTTKMLANYGFNPQLGDKFDMDSPINSSIVSYQQLIEKEDQSSTLDLTLAVDAAGRANVARYDVGDPIAVRYKNIGPIIEGSTHFSIQWDVFAYITSVGEVTSAPNSSIAVFPFSCEIGKSGSNSVVVTLINDVDSYEAA
jgi:hypothetical protein